MRPADALIDWLGRCPAVDGAAIVGWRFEVTRGQGLRAGVRDSRLGGPFEGPGIARRLGGSLELHWSDGLLTRVGLDRRSVLDPSSELAAWRADAVRDRHGRLPPLAEPAAVPQVETYDPAVDGAVTSSAEPCLQMLRELTHRGRWAGARRIDAVMRASRSERTVSTSRGFRADWRDTSCSIDLWADEIAGASYGRRSLPARDDLSRLVEQVSALASRLRTVQGLPATARGVLFMPPAVSELLGRLLLPNLSGRAIRDGRSPFTRADLDAARPILRADLDLVLDTTLPFELATAPCSSEGVPADRVSLIAEGRLISPTLDRTTAADFGLPPTPVPRGHPKALLTSALAAIGYAEALALLGDGVVVRDLPGLHTQQARRAAYALVAPDAQAVVSGEPGGRCAVRLAGSLLGHLTQPSTRLVRIPGDLETGLLVLSGVELLPA
jgi:predicted Zn-dependent protease